jgi:hypothetical protein
MHTERMQVGIPPRGYGAHTEGQSSECRIRDPGGLLYLCSVIQ